MDSRIRAVDQGLRFESSDMGVETGVQASVLTGTNLEAHLGVLLHQSYPKVAEVDLHHQHYEAGVRFWQERHAVKVRDYVMPAVYPPAALIMKGGVTPPDVLGGDVKLPPEWVELLSLPAMECALQVWWTLACTQKDLGTLWSWMCLWGLDVYLKLRKQWRKYAWQGARSHAPTPQSAQPPYMFLLYEQDLGTRANQKPNSAQPWSTYLEDGAALDALMDAAQAGVHGDEADQTPPFTAWMSRVSLARFLGAFFHMTLPWVVRICTRTCTEGDAMYFAHRRLATRHRALAKFLQRALKTGSVYALVDGSILNRFGNGLRLSLRVQGARIHPWKDDVYKFYNREWALTAGEVTGAMEEGPLQFMPLSSLQYRYHTLFKTTARARVDVLPQVWAARFLHPLTPFFLAPGGPQAPRTADMYCTRAWHPECKECEGLFARDYMVWQLMFVVSNGCQDNLLSRWHSHLAYVATQHSHPLPTMPSQVLGGLAYLPYFWKQRRLTHSELRHRVLIQNNVVYLCPDPVNVKAQYVHLFLEAGMIPPILDASNPATLPAPFACYTYGPRAGLHSHHLRSVLHALTTGTGAWWGERDFLHLVDVPVGQEGDIPAPTLTYDHPTEARRVCVRRYPHETLGTLVVFCDYARVQDIRHFFGHADFTAYLLQGLRSPTLAPPSPWVAVQLMAVANMFLSPWSVQSLCQRLGVDPPGLYDLAHARLLTGQLKGLGHLLNHTRYASPGTPAVDFQWWGVDKVLLSELADMSNPADIRKRVWVHLNLKSADLMHFVLATLRGEYRADGETPVTDTTTRKHMRDAEALVHHVLFTEMPRRFWYARGAEITLKDLHVVSRPYIFKGPMRVLPTGDQVSEEQYLDKYIAFRVKGRPVPFAQFQATVWAAYMATARVMLAFLLTVFRQPGVVRVGDTTSFTYQAYARQQAFPQRLQQTLASVSALLTKLFARDNLLDVLRDRSQAGTVLPPLVTARLKAVHTLLPTRMRLNDNARPLVEETRGCLQSIIDAQPAKRQRLAPSEVDNIVADLDAALFGDEEEGDAQEVPVPTSIPELTELLMRTADRLQRGVPGVEADLVHVYGRANATLILKSLPRT